MAIKDDEKHTPNPPPDDSQQDGKSSTASVSENSTSHSLDPVSLAVGAPVIGVPAVGQVHKLEPEDLELRLYELGDSLAERQALKFLCSFMREHPDPPRGDGAMVRDDFGRICQTKYGVGPRSFARLWHRAINYIGAVGYKKSGPRGPHTL